MNKLLALSLTAAGFALLPTAPASAHESTALATTSPGIVRINETVIIHESHRRHYRVEHTRVRRHGHWVVVTRRVYY